MPTTDRIPAKLRSQLVTVRQELDDLLDTYNPGEFLSWNVTNKPFELPKKTIQELAIKRLAAKQQQQVRRAPA